MNKRYSVTFKILELLGTGFQIRYTRSRDTRKFLYEEADILWHSIDRKQLYRTLRRLRLNKLVKIIKEGNNKERIELTNGGKTLVLRKHYDELVVKKRKRWDKKWRMVMYDIPEKKKGIRDAFRIKLKKLGFMEFQKSTFIYPYQCTDEINFLINFFDIEEYVYCIDAEIIPDDKLQKHFRL